MNNLLIYFAFPIAIIIFSIILQKLLHSPIAVASLIFATFIIVTFAAFDQNFLIATLVYTILSLLTALLTQVFCNDNSNTNNNLTKDETFTTKNSTTDTPEDDNEINSNNYGCMYNRRYRKC